MNVFFCYPRYLIPFILFCCLSFAPVEAFAYGGGGGESQGVDVLTGVNTTDNTKPPDGFTPSSTDGMSDYDFGGGINTTSQESSEDQRRLEEEINETIGRREIEDQKREAEEARNRPLTRAEVYNRAQQYLSNFPPNLRNQLTRRYTYQEIFSIRQLGVMYNNVQNIQDPGMRHIMQQALTNAQQNFVKNVQLRRAQQQDQAQRAREDAEFVAKFIVGVAVNAATAGGGKVGIAINIGYNAAVGGTRGAGTAAVATAITNKIPGGNVAANAIRDAVTQEAVNHVIEPSRAY